MICKNCGYSWRENEGCACGNFKAEPVKSLNCRDHIGAAIDVEMHGWRLFMFCSLCHSLVFSCTIHEMIDQPPNMLWRLLDGKEESKTRAQKEKESHKIT